MPKRTTDYRNALLEDLRDPVEAANYLNAALEDSPEMFLSALRDVAEARQMAKVAETAGVSRESLYRMLKLSGNPTYKSFLGVLRAVGLEFGGVRAPEGEQQPPVSFTTVSRFARSNEAKRRGRKRNTRRAAYLTAIPHGNFNSAPSAAASLEASIAILKKKPSAMETISVFGSLPARLFTKGGAVQGVTNTGASK